MNTIPRQKNVIADQIQGQNKPFETAKLPTANDTRANSQTQNPTQRVKRSQENDPQDPGSDSTFSA